MHQPNAPPAPLPEPPMIALHELATAAQQHWIVEWCQQRRVRLMMLLPQRQQDQRGFRFADESGQLYLGVMFADGRIESHGP